ncbi:MAG: 26S proteasome complex subunit [Ramalina farinacea]|uniref:26S proteasome complex subunit SEM1 n=1 Tax=Ramalina farinacea TaxID=258253 RepID=A0AA43TWR0_9LECA|nr:26S proteasome complex subunit [Ramalina farinacea]
MSAANSGGSSATTKATTADPASGPTLKDQQQAQKAATLEEDDEFEDFPVDDWPASEQEVPPGREAESTQHLWEESWDDDDTSEEFSKQLKAELDKVKGGKK